MAYLHIQQSWSNINIDVESCFRLSDDCESNVYAPFFAQFCSPPVLQGNMSRCSSLLVQFLHELGTYLDLSVCRPGKENNNLKRVLRAHYKLRKMKNLMTKLTVNTLIAKAKYGLQPL